jgi:short-subunit dehydrogenase
MFYKFFFIITLFCFQILCIFKYVYNNIKKYLFTTELNLTERYGENTWVLITGCSSGQGERFVYEFAKRNFNIILMGNKGIKKVEKKINNQYKCVKTITCVTNFRNAYKKNYFEQIETILNTLDGELSILVNNIGYRTAWYPYHKMPAQKINDTIICGTIVQARLTHLAIQFFEKRRNKQYKTGIINITAMCLLPSFWFGTLNYISVPYLSAYEAANAFGFYHSNSIQKEYGHYIDVLNIIPGAVITQNTPFLKDVEFSIDCKSYVKNIFKLIGNYTGPQTAYWKHEISGILGNFINTDTILLKVGKLIANYYMKINNNSCK